MENRNRTWPLFVGLFVCSLIMAFVTFAISRAEFNYSLWVAGPRGKCPPFMTDLLMSSYWAVWLLPAATFFVGALALARKIVSEFWLNVWIAVLGVLHVGWFFFWLLGLYLVNQSFHG